MADVHNRAGYPTLGPEARSAYQKAGDGSHRFLSGAEADPLQAPAGQMVQAFQGQGQVRSALVSRHGMDFVHDYRSGSRQVAAAPFGRE